MRASLVEKCQLILTATLFLKISQWPGSKVWTVSSRDSAQVKGTTRDFMIYPGDRLTATFAALSPQRGAACPPLASSANSSGVR